jgi:hypothetical protein
VKERDSRRGGLSADQLDWSLFENPERLRFVRGLDESDLASSDSLQRLARIGATASGTDFAQVSLIGDSQFVPASHGLTYEASDQHCAVGDTFCSLTMMSGGVFRVEDARLNEFTSDLPPVASGKVVAYLGVSLNDPDGRPVGALCVFHSEPRKWLDHDVDLISDLAQLAQRELHTSAALESAGMRDDRLRSVINELVELPKLGNGVHLKARAHYDHHAGAPAGGDWIDWSERPDRISFAIGDVAGHGLSSIVVMEELRHAMRAYAIHSDDLGDTILKTSELLRQLRPSDMATALMADFDPTTGRTRFAVAGHPAPIHCRDGRATPVPVEPGPPLGVMTEPPVVSEIVLEPGDRLILVTDGVFERRNESIDVGFERLVSAAERYWSEPDLEAAARSIVDDLVDDLDDDACLMLVERPAVGRRQQDL